MARPIKILDWNKVDQLIMAQNSAEEIASHFNMDVTTFYKKVNDAHGVSFSNYATIKYCEGISCIKTKRYQMAIQGNVRCIEKICELHIDNKITDQKQNIYQTNYSNGSPIEIPPPPIPAQDPPHTEQRSS